MRRREQWSLVEGIDRIGVHLAFGHTIPYYYGTHLERKPPRLETPIASHRTDAPLHGYNMLCIVLQSVVAQGFSA